MTSERAPRQFNDAPATAGYRHLFYGLIGPSSSGKTYSALRLATGMQRVVGGQIFLVDTENRRAEHYAEYFKFTEVPFAAPFSPSDYVDVVTHCLNKGAKTIVIDSMTHEHSGQGGCLEWHESEVARLSKLWNCSEEKANIPAWAKPKAARRKLINLLTQADANIIACFRAKDKIKVGGGKVVQLGWMPDAGEEFVFESAACSLLLPGAGGVPTWNSDQPGEKMMIKLPAYFRTIFSGKDGKPLDEDTGEALAKWAAGSAATKPNGTLTKDQVDALVDTMNNAATLPELKAAFEASWTAAGNARDRAARERLKTVYDLRTEDITRIK